MSLQTRLQSLITAVGADIKSLNTSVSNVAAQQTQLMSTAATVEELSVGVVQSGVWSSAVPPVWKDTFTADAAVVQTLWTAPWPCRLVSFDVVREFGTMTTSDTNYVNASIRRKVPNGSLYVIANKNTQIAGEAINSRVTWSFDGASWTAANALFNKGEFLSIEWTTFGTGSIRFPLSYTFRVVPV